MAEICFQTAPAGIWTERAVSQRSQKAVFNCRVSSHQSFKIWLQEAPGQDLGSQEAPRGSQKAPRRLPKAPRGSQKALKRLPARIWPKTAVSQGSQKGSLIAGRRASKWQKFASKRLLARIWAPRRLPEAPRRLPEGSQRLPEAPRRLSKGSRPGFGPKRPFPKDPRRGV